MGFLSKIKGRSKDQRPISDLDLDAATPTDLRSNDLISRPPPLDPRTERELRDACAIILADLKPSGHDLEDTRMKSDVLVGQDDVLDTRITSRAAQKQPAPPADRSAPWTMYRDPKVPPKSTSRLEPAGMSSKQLSAAMGSDIGGLNSLNNRQKPVNVPDRSSSNLGPEAPVAPLHSMTSSSMPFASPPARNPQRESASTTAGSSNFHQSTDHSKSASTTLSSAPFTPSEASHRLSDHTYRHQASAKESQWMKDTVDKQKQAYVTEATPTTQAYIRSPVNALKSPANDVPQRSPSTGSRTRGLHSHPISDGVGQPPPAGPGRASSRQSGSIVASSLPPRPASAQSKRSSRNASGRLSIDGLKETDRSPAASPLQDDVPPVPPIDTSRVNSMKTMARPLSQISTAASARGETPSRKYEYTNGTVNGAGRPPANQSDWPITNQAATRQHNTPQQKNALGETFTAKDASQHLQRFALEGFKPLNRDPRPEDFDNLMSAMNHHASLGTDGGMDSPTVPPGTIRTLRNTENAPASPRPIVAQQAVAGASSGSAIGSPSSRPGVNVANGPQSPTYSVSREAGGRSPSIAGSRASDSRSIQAALSAKSGKEHRGVRGLFMKLGGDTSRRRSPTPIHITTGYGGFEDYWADADDQACAAPVVGFGRGW